MSMIDVQMQTPSPLLPPSNDDTVKAGALSAPAPRPSATFDDDLEPYNLPFTD